MHEGIWKVLFKANQSWSKMTEDRGYNLNHPTSSASMLAATSHSAEVSKLKQMLEQADEELGRVKKQLEDKQGPAAEVESLKNALTEAQKKAEKEQAARKKNESRAGKVQQELKDAASLLAATSQAAEVSDLKRRLQLADDDIDRMNKWFDEAQGSAAEVETLKSALAQDKEEAKYEERVTEAEQELKDAAGKCESLEKKNKAQAAELAKALQEAKEAQTESWAAREEIRQSEQIAADAFADLPKSAADVTQFFRAQAGHTTEKLFWSQFAAPERPALLNNLMMQLAELNRMFGLAMKDIIVRLWPTEPIPSSYIGLV
nr:tropomyosin-2-like [Aegilops tauschii subsp. strangulata]